MPVPRILELTGDAEATAAVEHARRRGVLHSTDGPRRNVVKIKPPMAISATDAARCLNIVDEALDRSRRPTGR